MVMYRVNLCDWSFCADGCLKRANGASNHGCFTNDAEETRDCYCDMQCYKYKDCCQDILFITCHCGSPLTVEECSVGYSELYQYNVQLLHFIFEGS